MAEAALAIKQDSWPSFLQDVAAEYADKTTDELVAALKDAMGVTVKSLCRVAVLVRLLKERGYDLSELRIGMVAWLEKIAYGQVLPEIVQRYHGSSLIMRKLAGLPLDEQRRVASDEPLQVLTFDESGRPTHRLVAPSKMTPAEAHQVFAADHIRDLGEQRSYLESRKPRTARRRSGVFVDMKRRGLVVRAGGEEVFLSAEDLSQYLTRLLRK